MFTIACIPAYNEERNIAKTIRNVAKFVNQVIVCDDGSTDNTVSEAENTGAYVIKLQKNAGKGAMQFGKSKAKMLTPSSEKVTFADVAGIN